MDTLRTDAGLLAAEITVKGSRFIAELFPCENAAQSRVILKAQKAKYKDATHVVHAFITGEKQEVRGASDDGEPGGTAGRPAASVLGGRGCTNVMLTVTRYFGGTLLGTGGLVKAYSDAAKAVIAAAEAAGAFCELVKLTPFCFECEYAFLNAAEQIAQKYRAEDVQKVFGSKVRFTGKVRAEAADEFMQKIMLATSLPSQ